MNILYFFEYAPDPQRGGASRLTRSLINYWDKERKDFSFYCAYFKKEKNYITYFKDEILLDLNDKIQFTSFLDKNQISIIVYQMAFSKEYFDYVKECNHNNLLMSIIIYPLLLFIILCLVGSYYTLKIY